MTSGDSTPTAPHGLQVGGQALWESATKLKTFHPGELVVLEEACRIKDRLDLFAALLDGDESMWCSLREVADSDRAVLVVDGAVTEARLHAGELRQLVEKLRIPMALAGEAKEPVDDPLAAARAARDARKTGATGR